MAKIHRTKLQGLPSYFTSWGLKPFDNDAAFVTAKGSVATEGDAYYNSTDDEIRVFDGTNWRTVITADASGNVIIDGNLTVDGTSTTLNTQTLDVEDVNITVNHNGNQTSADNVAGITVEMSDAQDAALIYDKDVASRFLIGETNALKEVADVSSTQTFTGKTVVVANNTITTAAVGNLAATELNAALSELQSDIDTRATSTDLTNHINNTTGAHAASAVSFINTTSGLAATQVQAALDEIDGDLDAHIGSTSNPHSVTATQVGLGNVDNTSDATKNSAAADLTNKTINADLNTVTNIKDADIKSGAAIARNKLANGTANHVIINDASGVMSSEAALAKVRGGTGADNSSVTFPSTGTIATLAGTEGFSNKSISDALTYSHITTPASPSAGALKIYAKNDDKFYKLNSVGEEVEIGSGASGAGGINFFVNPDFETNIADWTSSDAGVALSAETAAPLVGERSLLVTKDAANRENEFVSGTTRDIDLAYRGRPLPFSFEFDTTDANYASDDVRVAVYDNTNAAYLYVAPVSNVSDTLGLLKTSGKALVMVYPESTTVSITPRLIINSTNATSYALKFDAFKIGPDMVVPGVYRNEAVLDATSSGSFTGGTVLVSRVGGLVTVTTLTALTHASLSDRSSAAGFIPEWARPTSATATNISGVDGTTEVYNAVTTAGLLNIYTYNTTSGAGVAQTSGSVKLTYNVQDNLSASLSTTEAAWSTGKARMYRGTSAQAVASTSATTVQFNAESFATGGLTTDLANYRININKSSYYLINFVNRASNFTQDENLRADIKNSTESIAIAYGSGSSASIGSANLSTVVYLEQGDYVYATMNSGADTSWEITHGSNITYLEVIALPDFSTFSVFGKSEVIESSNSTAQNVTGSAGDVLDLTSILLPPGEWDLSGDVTYNSNGATTTTIIGAWTSTTSGNTATGRVIGYNTGYNTKATTTSTLDSCKISPHKVVVTTPTTYYLKGQAQTSITNLQYRYHIRARRIK